MHLYCPQEVTQSSRITPNEVEVTNSNPPPLFCADMSKKKKKKKSGSYSTTGPLGVISLCGPEIGRAHV